VAHYVLNLTLSSNLMSYIGSLGKREKFAVLRPLPDNVCTLWHIS